MCIDFNGYHSGGSSFVYVNDFWLLQKLLYTHRYKFSSVKKKKGKESQIYSIAPWTQFEFANRVGPGIGA